MNIRRKLRSHTEVTTGPLNDILFILLLFFLIAATLANPNLVRVNNPRGSKDMQAKQNIIITVDDKHQFYLGTTLIDASRLDTLLKAEIEKTRLMVDTPSVIINADTSALYGEVFRIMALAKRYNAKVGVHVR